MKTTTLADTTTGQVPVYGFANLLLSQAEESNAKTIAVHVKGETATIFLDDEQVPPPTLEVLHCLHIPFLKYAGLIKWPWRKTISNKRFVIICNGVSSIWQLSSTDIYNHLVIERV